MRAWIVTSMLIVVGIIHLLPGIGVLGGTRLTSLYGLPFDGPDLVVLMRHRAVLFALLGALLVIAVFRLRFSPLLSSRALRACSRSFSSPGPKAP